MRLVFYQHRLHGMHQAKEAHKPASEVNFESFRCSGGPEPRPEYKLMAENAGNKQAALKSKMKAGTRTAECKTPEALTATGDALILLRYQV